ncbi:MAG: BrnT family toxin [Hyphomicrobiaceae bacterium]
MPDDEFEWDDSKAIANRRKHHVSFETAREAFDDANWVEVDDYDPDEQRFLRLCFYRGEIYAMLYVERNRRIRIISARRATNHEQRRYEEEHGG